MHFSTINFKNIFHSAILKLTIFYVLIAMAISVSFSIALYQISSRELGKGLGKQTGILRDIPVKVFINQAFPDFEQLRLQQLEDSSNHLKLSLVYFNLLIFLLSSGASYLLARKTFEPIEKAMDAQNRFTADASHELRTPLTAMRTEIEVNLRDKKFSLTDAKKLLKSNLEEVEKLESLSSALLKLARYEDKGNVDLLKTPLEDIIIEAYERIEALASKKSIEIICHPKLDSGSFNMNISGDKESLTELFVILLENAIKYSPEKSKVKIKVKNLKKLVFVSIKDKGVGIKACDLPFIFNRFYRADASRSKGKVDGYGLGLSIAKRIIELHKGSIWANSKLGQGSEFVVRLNA